jgi:hypothetical protein
MATPFTDYVVELLTDSGTLTTFQTSRDSAVAAMTTAGLSADQQEVLLRADGPATQDEIAKEILGGQGVPPNKQSVFHATSITKYDT